MDSATSSSGGVGTSAPPWSMDGLQWDASAMVALPAAAAPAAGTQAAVLSPPAPSAPPGPRRGRHPRAMACQVPGCPVTLTRELHAAYNVRYRLCDAHAKADEVNLNGDVSRWCQKCSRFQPLTAFSAQRTAAAAGRSGGAGPDGDVDVVPGGTPSRGRRAPAPPPLVMPPHFGTTPLFSDDELAALVHAAGTGGDAAAAEGAAGRAAGGDAQPPLPGGSAGAAFGNIGGGDDWMSGLAFAAVGEPRGVAPAGAADAPPPPLVAPLQPGAPPPAAPPLWDAAAGAQVKFHDSVPGELPPVLSSFFSTWMHSAVTLGYIQPGCTLLTVIPLRPIGASGRAGASGDEAAALAAALLEAAPQLRGQRLTVRCAADGTGASVAASGAIAALPRCAPRGDAPPALQPLSPRALCTSAASEARSAAAAPRSGAVAARFHGHELTALKAVGGAGGSPLTVALPACGLEGAMTLGLDDIGSSTPADADVAADKAEAALPPLPSALRRGRPLLLTPHAAVAAEVASLHLDAPGGDGADMAEEEADALILTIGAALWPNAPPALVAAAAAAAALRRWPHTLERLLVALDAAADGSAAAVDDSASVAGAQEGRTVLHAAAAGGCLRCIAMALRAAERGGPAAPLLGAPAARDAADGATPLHLAASRVGIEALRALAAACPAAPLAFFGARDAAGATPADALMAAAAAWAPAAAAADAASFRAAMRAALGAGIAAARAAMAAAAGSAAAAHAALSEADDVAAAAAAELLRFAFHIQPAAAAMAGEAAPAEGDSGVEAAASGPAGGTPAGEPVTSAPRARSRSTPAPRVRVDTRSSKSQKAAEAPATVTPADDVPRPRRTRAAPAPRRAVFPAQPAEDA